VAEAPAAEAAAAHDEDGDLALALQLQEEERRQAERRGQVTCHSVTAVIVKSLTTEWCAVLVEQVASV
jgi:hypothetical protein